MLDIMKTDEEILAFDVSDEALEIATGKVSDKANFTLGACTGLSVCPGLATDYTQPGFRKGRREAVFLLRAMLFANLRLGT